MRIRNTLLAIIAALLLVNLGVMLSPAVQAVPKAQYKAVRVRNGPTVALNYQEVLDQQSAQGWEFVDGDGGTLIFKK